MLQTVNDDVNARHGTSAKVIKDSISPRGDRLTTMEVTFHRFVLAEFNTHRVFSRNSASSRAIPFRKQVARVVENPAIPVSFPAEQRGMQGGDELGGVHGQRAQDGWLAARDAAVAYAQQLAEYGVHKSVVNRLLEPFMWHTVIVTATEWDNFFHQRCHEDAQPEIRVAAEMMREAFSSSKPEPVGFGGWHMPYIEQEDRDAAHQYAQAEGYAGGIDIADERASEILRKVSAARCARVSYLTHDGQRSLDKDLDLYNRLVLRALGDESPIHWSPLEHVARPSAMQVCKGNFHGWKQLRHIIGGK